MLRVVGWKLMSSMALLIRSNDWEHRDTRETRQKWREGGGDGERSRHIVREREREREIGRASCRERVSSPV